MVPIGISKSERTEKTRTTILAQFFPVSSAAEPKRNSNPITAKTIVNNGEKIPSKIPAIMSKIPPIIPKIASIKTPVGLSLSAGVGEKIELPQIGHTVF